MRFQHTDDDYEPYDYPPEPALSELQDRFGDQWVNSYQATTNMRIRQLGWQIKDAMTRGFYPNTDIAARIVISGENYGTTQDSYGSPGYTILIDAIRDSGLWHEMKRRV